MIVNKTGSSFFASYKLELYIVGGVTFLQPLHIVGTFGTNSYDTSITTGIFETPRVSSLTDISANITLTLDGTSYTKTIQRSFSSSTTDYITLTDSVSP